MKIYCLLMFAAFSLSTNFALAETCAPKVPNSMFAKFQMELVNSQDTLKLSEIVLGPKALTYKDPSMIWPKSTVGKNFAPSKYGSFDSFYTKTYWRIQILLSTQGSQPMANIHWASTDGVYFYETYLCK